jgi:hypothetical protein
MSILLNLVSKAARIVAPAMPPRSLEWDPIKHVLAEINPDVTWEPITIVNTEGDIQVVFVTNSRAEHAVVKTAWTEEGMTALERNIQNVAALKADARLSPYHQLLPTILNSSYSDNSLSTVEELMVGMAGEGSNEAAYVIARALHARTARPTLIEQRWLDKWIHKPVALLKQLNRGMKERRTRSLDNFANRQERHWSGTLVPLGWSHGDYSPQNILYNGEHEISGIVDWDRAEPDSPAGMDQIHLEVATRRARTGEEFGTIVKAKLKEGHDPIIELMWLHQVTANMEKSSRYANSLLWTLMNVDQVLHEYLKR